MIYWGVNNSIPLNTDWIVIKGVGDEKVYLGFLVKHTHQAGNIFAVPKKTN